MHDLFHAVNRDDSSDPDGLSGPVLVSGVIDHPLLASLLYVSDS